MQTELEKRRLSEFVNRKGEIDRFCQLLDSREKHIMIVWGEPGMGKTSLRLRMVHECAKRNLHKAEVECGGTRTSGYLAIMRKIRDDAGIQHFNELSDYINYLTDPEYQSKVPVQVNVNVRGDGNLAVAEQAHISSSNVGDIAGVVVKDNMLVLPRSDIAVPEEERMLRLTDHFFGGLSNALKEGVVVVFLDNMEKLASDTERWLWEELLFAVREGRLSGIKFVLCGEMPPQLDRDWRFFVEEAELQPLKQEHVETYLEKRGVEEGLRQGLATFLMANTNGNISLIAEQVDAFLQLQEKMDK